MRSSQPAITPSELSPARKPGISRTGLPSPCGTPRPWKTGSTVRRASSACQRSSWTWGPHHTPWGPTGPAMAGSYVNAACRRGDRRWELIGKEHATGAEIHWHGDGDLGRRAPHRAGAARDERADVARAAPVAREGQALHVGGPVA